MARTEQVVKQNIVLIQNNNPLWYNDPVDVALVSSLAQELQTFQGESCFVRDALLNPPLTHVCAAFPARIYRKATSRRRGFA
jgi:hypothetical protein